PRQRRGQRRRPAGHGRGSRQRAARRRRRRIPAPARAIIPGMDRYERIIALHRPQRAARYPLTVQRLQHALGRSRATVYRDLAFLRDALMAPVVGDGEAGFRYDPDEADRFELPGLWLTSDELHALLAAQQLLARSSGGMLSSALAPLQARIDKLLAEHSAGKRWPVER